MTLVHRGVHSLSIQLNSFQNIYSLTYCTEMLYIWLLATQKLLKLKIVAQTIKLKLYVTVWSRNGVPAEIGGFPNFLAKSLVISTMDMKFKLIAHNFKLEFCKYGWNYQ